MAVDWSLLIAGLGLFMLGMDYLERALRSLLNQSSTAVLQRGTASLWLAIPLGTLMTALMQSSSLVGLLVLALVGAGAMPMRNALGIILGANLGTTATGWLVTMVGFKLDLTAASLPLIGVGALLLVLLARYARWLAIGRLMLGFGFLLFGLTSMKTGVASVTTGVDLDYLAGLHSFWFLLVGVLLAAVIQSSSAVVMLVLSGLHAQLLPLPSALAMIIGADVGTSSTMLLAAAGGAVVKRQVAVFHLIYNAISAVFSYLLLLPLALWVFTRIGLDDPLYSLVLFHSSFNFFGIFLFLPWLPRLADWLEHHVGATVSKHDLRQRVPVSVPGAAVIAVEQEARRMVAFTSVLIAQAFNRPPPTAHNLSTQHIGAGMAAYINSYEQLKREESSLVAYVGDIVTAESAQHLALQSWLAVVRLSVYSAKAIKDIRDDLEALWLSQDARFQSLREGLVAVIEPLLDALDKQLVGELGPGDIEVMAAGHARQIEQLQKHVYLLKGRLDPELSTLMNVVREADECGREVIRLLQRWPAP